MTSFLYPVKRLPESKWRACRDLRLEALQAEPLAFGSAFEAEVPLTEKEWRYRIQNALFALDQQEPVGMVVLIGDPGPKARHIANIYGLYVKASHRGNGIGYHLMAAALQEIRAWKRIRKVKLAVNVEQKAAITLYEQLGFVAVGKLKDELYYQGKYYDELIMERFW